MPSSIDTFPERLFILSVLVLKFRVPLPVFLNPCEPISSVKIAKRPVLTSRIGTPLVEFRVRLPSNDVAFPKRTIPVPFIVTAPATALVSFGMLISIVVVF